MDEPKDFAEFVQGHSRTLRTAWLLTGSWCMAVDLVQTALAKTWPKWAGIAVAGREACVRRVMTTRSSRGGVAGGRAKWPPAG